MVSPSHELNEKLKRTQFLVDNYSPYMVESLSQLPEYLDIQSYNILQSIKPWINRQLDVSNNVSLVTDTHSLSATSPLYVYPDKVLVLCVDFIDKPASISIQSIVDRFTSQFSNSFVDYFTETSYGKFIPSAIVKGWYRAPQPYSYYVNNQNGFGTYPQNSAKLIQDIVDIASRDIGIDWNSIDSNADSIIPYIFIVHSGGEAAWTGITTDFWASAWSMGRSINIGNTGKSYFQAIISSEYMSSPADIQRSGVDCHEMGHALGLPDLYDYSWLSEGVGVWSIMGGGSWNNGGITPSHLDAWSKVKLGFATATTNFFSTSIQLPPNETYDTIYKYLTNIPNEYFLIENREQIFYDTYLPGKGILIWHINENKTSNDDRTCFLVGLIQADNRKDLEYKVNRGDFSDPFGDISGVSSFGYGLIPSSYLCDMSMYDIKIINIVGPIPVSNNMSFDAIEGSNNPILTASCPTQPVVQGQTGDFVMSVSGGISPYNYQLLRDGIVVRETGYITNTINVFTYNFDEQPNTYQFVMKVIDSSPVKKSDSSNPCIIEVVPIVCTTPLCDFYIL